ncbi:hypothetical protein ABK040_014302 [Willaertia magna]
MQAQIIEDYSEEDNFIFKQDYSIPEIKENQVLVQMKAASVNPADNHLKSGSAKLLFKLKFPCVMGKDGSGIVVKVGSKVTQFKEGDEVCGELSGIITGTFAQYCAFDEDDLVKKPNGMNYSQAAAFPLVSGTAVEGFKSHPKISQVISRDIAEIDRSGQLTEPTIEPEREKFKILIIGASGGIGATAVLFAKQYLTRHFNVKVYAVCSERNVEMVKALGADVVIDYTKTSAKAGSQTTHHKGGLRDMPSICQVLKNEHGEDAVDLVLDTVGGYYYHDDVCCHMHCNGNNVVFAAIAPPGTAVITLRTLISFGYFMIVNRIKSWLPSYPKYTLVNYIGKEQKALNLLMNHVLTIDNAFERMPLTHFSLLDLNEGFKLIASKRTAGKIIIDIPDVNTANTSESKEQTMAVKEIELPLEH